MRTVAVLPSYSLRLKAGLSCKLHIRQRSVSLSVKGFLWEGWEASIAMKPMPPCSQLARLTAHRGLGWRAWPPGDLSTCHLPPRSSSQSVLLTSNDLILLIESLTPWHVVPQFKPRKACSTTPTVPGGSTHGGKDSVRVCESLQRHP